MPDDKDDTSFLPAFQQFMEVYIGPEIERRRQSGELREGFKLVAAQVMFFSDGRSNVVRLNSEVRALAKVPIPPGRAVTKGQRVTWADIPELTDIDLDPAEDPDAGHITALATPGGWILAFNARYNRGLSRQHLQIAGQFLRAAQRARSESEWHSCVDNLFTACELAARAKLLSIPNRKFRSGSSHPEIKNRFRTWARLGNVEPHEHEAFNKLSAWRRSARYLETPLHVDAPTLDRLIQIVDGMIQSELPRVTPKYQEEGNDI